MPFQGVILITLIIRRALPYADVSYAFSVIIRDIDVKYIVIGFGSFVSVYL